jgi:hypothetical protein
VAATTSTKKKKNNSNEPVLYKRERNKINSLARVLQLENALYNDETVMRFAAISNQIDRVDKNVEDLRMDMQSAIHNEFVYLGQKMLLPRKNNSDNSALIDYGAAKMIIYLRNHAKSFTIRVTEEKEDGGFSGQCLELPAVISQGETLQELRQNMKEAIELATWFMLF